MGLSVMKKVGRVALIAGFSLALLGASLSDEESLLALAEEGVGSNSEWEPLLKRFDGALMALVPTGSFMMGGEEFPDEQPVHEIRFDAPFWIDVYQVTTAQFADFMNSPGADEHTGADWVTGYNSAEEQFTRIDGLWVEREGYENSAVFGVTWHEATAFCEYRGARLATEAEWEYAARGPDGLIYPWGNDLITENIAKFGGGMPIAEGTGVPLVVGTKPEGVSWVGALDMSGNVCEWVHSIYRPYPYVANDGREVDAGVDAVSERVLRGWAWYHPNWVDPVRSNDRFCLRPHLSIKFFGFRCARDYVP